MFLALRGRFMREIALRKVYSVHFVSALTEHPASQLTTLSRLKGETTQHTLMTCEEKKTTLSC